MVASSRFGNFYILDYYYSRRDLFNGPRFQQICYDRFVHNAKLHNCEQRKKKIRPILSRNFNESFSSVAPKCYKVPLRRKKQTLNKIFMRMKFCDSLYEVRKKNFR